MTSPPSPVNRSNLCSHQAFSCPLLPHGRVSFRLVMVFPGDFESQFASRVPPSPVTLMLSSKTAGYPGWPCLHLSGRPTGGAFQRNPFSQRCTGTTGGNALTSYVTSPPQLISAPKRILFPSGPGPCSQVVRKGREQHPHFRCPPSGCHRCQQQLQQSLRPLLSLVPLRVLAHGVQGIAEAYVRDQPFTHSRPSRWRGLGGVYRYRQCYEQAETR